MRKDVVCRFRSRLIALALVTAAGALLQACTESPPDEGLIAVWDGGRLARADYEAWLDNQDMAPSPEAVRRLSLIMSMAAAARRRGMEESAPVVLEVEAKRQEKLLPALKRHVDAKVSISDEELDELAARYPDAFRQPRKLFLRGIFKRLPRDETASAVVRRQMQTLRAQVVQGADIKSLAARESESQSRFRDGSIGFVDPNELPLSVRDAVANLETGEASELIEHAGGLAFYVSERISPEVIPDAEQMRFKFRQNLFRERSAELNKALLEKLDAQVMVRLDQDPVLQAGRHELPAGWIDDLIRHRLPDRDPGSLTDRQKQRLLREWGRRLVMADRADELGLVEAGAMSEAMRWNLLNALATAELRFQVDTRLRPATDSERLALYEQRTESLYNPNAFRVEVIHFSAADGASRPEVVALARDTMARIRAGQLDFSEAARNVSLHPSAEDGGRLGWVTARELGGLEIRLLQPVRELSPGENSGLLRTAGGLWAVKVLDKRPATPMTLEQARGRLDEIFRQEQIKHLESEIRERHLADMALRILDS